VTEDTCKDLLEADLADKCFRAELRRRLSKEVTTRILNEDLSQYETKGYRLHKSHRNHLIVKRPKSISESMEDRLWLMFYRMGFSELNPHGFSVPIHSENGERTKQIDVVARDGNEIVVVECKASGKKESLSLRKDIAELGALKHPLEKWARKSVCSKARLTMVLALVNIGLSENDRQDAKGYDLVVWESEEIDYYEKLSQLIGSSTKYQLFSNLFGDAPFPEELDPVPAISGSMGTRRFYSFCMTPAALLKIAYVHHRFAHRSGENAYQRMLDKSKLKKISAFLDSGRFFPNNIIVNFTRKPEFIENATVGNIRFGYLKPASYYASAWVVDGQHRLYGYANHQRKNSDLLQITAFEDMNEEEQGGLFVEINKNQKAVEANLLWDLYSEIYEYSDNPRQEELRTIANIAKKLNRGTNSPFHNRIYIPSQNVKSEETNVTIQTVCTAIRRNRIVSKGMLFREDYETTERFASERIAEFFDFISERLADDWAKGESGFTRSNNGIATLFIILREVVRYVAFREEKDFGKTRWKDLVERTMDPVVRFIDQMDKTQRDKLRGRASSEGQRLEIAKDLANTIRKIFPDFAPKLETPTGEVEEEPDETLVRTMELDLRHFVRERLETKYKEEWYRKGVPEDVKVVIEERKKKDTTRYPYRETEISQRPAILMDFTDIVHLGRIITWENNHDVFSSVFGNADETRRRIEEFQSYRNSVRHDRDIDDVAKKTGKAAIAWIKKCMGAGSARSHQYGGHGDGNGRQNASNVQSS